MATRKPRRVSNSELVTARRCARRWYLGYWRKLQPIENEMVGPRPIGTRVHLALESYYSAGQDADALWDVFNESVKKDRPLVPLEDEANWLKEIELCRIMLEGYVDFAREEGIDQNIEFLAVEEELNYPLTERHVLTGKVDSRVLDKHTGEKYFIDHKTVPNLSDPVKVLQLDTQLLTYQLLIKLLGKPDDLVTGGIYNMLRKVKRTARATPPFYSREKVHHNDEELRNHWLHTWAVVRQIAEWEMRLEAGENHQSVAPPTPDRSCAWSCDFFLICPMFDDGSDAEGFAKSAFSERNPYERYEQKGGEWPH